MATIYKICPEPLWREAEEDGVFRGARIDHHDGFIHFSTADQVAETLAKHFAGERNLVLVAVDAQHLGPALRYEQARDGALFPHLYIALDLGAVLWVKPIEVGPDGVHILPDLDP
jgi:uncharacterized protein (DUF952 family)